MEGELRDTFKLLGSKCGFMGCSLAQLVELPRVESDLWPFAACRLPLSHPVSCHLSELFSQNLLRTVYVTVLLTADWGKCTIFHEKHDSKEKGKVKREAQSLVSSGI